MLAYSIRLAILSISLANDEVMSSAESNCDLKSLISFLRFSNKEEYCSLWFLSSKNSSLIAFSSTAAAWNFRPLFVLGIDGISIVFSIDVLEELQLPSFFAASILLISSSGLSFG